MVKKLGGGQCGTSSCGNSGIETPLKRRLSEARTKWLRHSRVGHGVHFCWPNQSNLWTSVSNPIQSNP